MQSVWRLRNLDSRYTMVCLFAQRGKRRERDMDKLLKRHRVHVLVTLGHDQRRATTLVHAAKPPGIQIWLVQVLFARLGVLADLHRHATRRARITVAGNNNSAISIPLFLAQVLTPVLHGKISEWARQIFCPFPVGVVHGAGVSGSVGSTMRRFGIAVFIEPQIHDLEP